MICNRTLQKCILTFLFVLAICRLILILAYLNYFRHNLAVMVLISTPNILLIIWMLSDVLHRYFITPFKRKWWIFAVTTLDVIGIFSYYFAHKRKEWNPLRTWPQQLLSENNFPEKNDA